MAHPRQHTGSASPAIPKGGFVISSLGCKVNQAEAASLARDLERTGLKEAGEGPAGLVVLMTCSVTGAAARQSRQAARRLARAHPEAKLVISGCDAQAEAEAYRAEGFIVLGRSQLNQLAAMCRGETAFPNSDGPGAPDKGGWVAGLRPPLPGRSRSLLKVQDGCNAFCAYCIVPYTRGRSRSLPIEQACGAWRELGEAGSREVVLTGIHLGKYGLDLESRPSLTDLIQALLKAHPGPRLRLSSLEVSEIGPELINMLKSHPRLCRHLHIPLQSGSAKVLKAMARPYTPEQFKQTVLDLHDQVEGICIGADVLEGLPGEDEQAFSETRSLIEELPLSYLHVFPYSPRPGTRAAQMQRPHPSQAKERAGILRELARGKQTGFLRSQVGGRFQGVVEENGLARTGNYCLAALDQDLSAGSLVHLEAVGVDDSGQGPRLSGRVISEPF